MCLAVPGRILSAEEHGASRLARVEFGGIAREVVLDFVPEAEVGDYVLVHVGFAIGVLDAEEAERRLDLFREMGLLGAAECPLPERAVDPDGDASP